MEYMPTGYGIPFGSKKTMNIATRFLDSLAQPLEWLRDVGVTIEPVKTMINEIEKAKTSVDKAIHIIKIVIAAIVVLQFLPWIITNIVGYFHWFNNRVAKKMKTLRWKDRVAFPQIQCVFHGCLHAIFCQPCLTADVMYYSGLKPCGESFASWYMWLVCFPCCQLITCSNLVIIVRCMKFKSRGSCCESNCCDVCRAILLAQIGCGCCVTTQTHDFLVEHALNGNDEVKKSLVGSPTVVNIQTAVISNSNTGLATKVL